MDLIKRLQEAKMIDDENSIPTIDDLSDADIKLLDNLKDVKNVGVIDTWEDDNLSCFSAKFTDQSGKKWKLAFWWVDPQIIGAVEYADSSVKAKEVFKNLIKSKIINREV